ncbi:hypothetical protein THRCLA_22074 [Thraustotheca clavata]|uniref:Uncharacterized protein n=1 Tax=Thraustotheca clavata TaxID=74557 RepID=A0A1V9ZCU5_9STRA|nr:hypothetical protein THRCLA_22074 [Thraustotheca clavata]
MRCVFRDCSEPVLPDSHKCAFHKNRRLCSVVGCENQVYARKLCVKHGARKRCAFPKCHAFTQGYVVCPEHHYWQTGSTSRKSPTSSQEETARSPMSFQAQMYATTEPTTEPKDPNLDQFVLSFTPQWIESYDLAWLEGV